MGSSCSCHPSYGAHLRAKNIRVAYSGQGGGDATAQKRWDAELNGYYNAVAQGIEPAGTTAKAVREAVELSNKVGKAFNAVDGSFS